MRGLCLDALTLPEINTVDALLELLPPIAGEDANAWLRRALWAGLITQGEHHRLCDGINFGIRWKDRKQP